MDLSEEMCFLKLLESLALSSESVLISPSPHFVLDKMASPTYCPSFHQDRLQSSRSMSTMSVDWILGLVRISRRAISLMKNVEVNFRPWYTNPVPSRAAQHQRKGCSCDQEQCGQLGGVCPAVQGESGLPLLDLAPWEDT